MSKKLREIMAALVIAALLSTGALAQGRGKDKDQDKRPDKKPVKVIDGKGGSKPPEPPPKQPKEKGDKKP